MYQNGSEWMLHYLEWRLLSVRRIPMRRSSSAALPAFIKPLINEMTAAGFHIYPRSATSDIQYGGGKWDRNHPPDKCYLISAVVQTVIQVYRMSFMTKSFFPLFLLDSALFMSAIVLAPSIKSELSMGSTFTSILLCISPSSIVDSQFLFAFTSAQKEISSQSSTTCPSLITDPNALHRN